MQSKFVLSALLATSLLHAPQSHAIAVRSDQGTEASKQFAETLPDAIFQIAVIQEIQPGVTSFSSRGTGVLIDPHWVLTAAHVVSPHMQGGNYNGLSAMYGQDMKEALDNKPRRDNTFQTLLNVNPENVHYAPNWTPQHIQPAGISALDQFEGDLALLRLNDPIYDIEPLSLKFDNTPAGTEVVYAGYGLIGTEETEQLSQENFVLRAATNRLIPRPPTPAARFTEFLYTRFDADVLSSTTPLEGTLAPGDSGGPVLVETADGYEVIGIHSWTSSPPSDAARPYGTIGASTSLASFSDYDEWILSTTTIPAPGSSLVLFAAAYAATNRRRGRCSLTH